MTQREQLKEFTDIDVENLTDVEVECELYRLTKIQEYE